MADSTPPSISGNVPASEVGVQYSFTPTIVSTGAFSVAVTAGALPKGLIISATSGAISGTPTTEGDYSYTLTVTDSNGSTEQAFTGTVYPTLSVGGTPPKGKTGIAYSFTPVVTGGSGKYTFSSTGDAGGLTVSKTDGTISGTPPTSGNYAFTITVNDGLTSKDLTANIEIDENITVAFTNTPMDAYLGQAYSWTPTFKNQKAGSTLTVVVLKGTLPDGLSLDAHTGIISGQPTSIQTSDFELNVSDGNTASSSSFTVVTYQALKLTGDPGVGKVSQPYTFTPTAVGGNSGNYTFSLKNAPGSDVFPLTLDAKTGVITGTPVVGGQYKITLDLTDGTATVEETFTFDIRALLTLTGVPNDAIVGTPFKFAPVAAGGTGNYTFSTTLVVPSPLTFSTSTGVIKGFPASSGSISGKITVDDGNDQVSLPVTITFGDRQTYMTAFRLEHFKGYGNTGSPNYSNVTASDAGETYRLGSVNMVTTVPQNTSGWGYGCLWREFTNADGTAAKVNNFWACIEMNLPTWSGNTNETYLIQYAPVVFHGGDEKGFLYLKSDISHSGQYRVLLSKDLTDTVNFIDTNIRITQVNQIGSYYFNVVGAGTPNGSISVYFMGTPRSQWITVGSWSGDLTDYKDFHAMSFHLAFSGAPYTNVYYAFVTNYDLHYAYLRYTVATGIGTEQGWTGDTTTFGTYPVSYNLTGGLYASQAGQSVTLAFGADLTPVVGVEPKTVILSGSFVTDSSATVAPIKGIVKSSDGTITEVGPTQTPDDQGESFMWAMSKNPATGALWNAADAAAFEYGYRRVTPPLQPLVLSGKPDPAYVSATYSFQFNVTGGDNTQYKYTVDKLPAGLAIDAVTGIISGTPTTAGSVTTTVTLTDTHTTTTLTSVFNVAPAVALSGPTMPTGYVGNAFTWTPTISNIAAGQTAVVSVGAGGLPNGLSLNAGTGAISGTPSVTGSFDFLLKVTDSITTSTTSLTIAVDASVALGGDDPGKARVGSAFTWTPTIDNALSGSTIKVTSDKGLPDGLVLNSSTGVISGTPTAVSPTTQYTLTVTDGNSSSARIISLSVTAGLVMSGTPDSSFVGKTYSWVPTFANQDPAGTLVVSLASDSTLPDGLVLDSSTGAVSGTPTTAGSTDVVFKATDGSSTVTTTFTFSIKPTISLSYTPQSDNYTVVGSIGKALPTITPVVSNADGDVTYSISADDTTALTDIGLSFDTTTGVFSGSPTATKNLTISVTATDSHNSATFAFHLGVSGLTIEAPDGAVATQGTQFGYGINPSGGSGTVTLGVASGSTLPDGLSLTSNTLTGWPTTLGDYEFTITATDAIETVSKAASISVVPMTWNSGNGKGLTFTNDRPFTAQLVKDASLTGTVTYNLHSGMTLPTNMSLDSATGIITGKVTSSDEAGISAIEIDMSDGTTTVVGYFYYYHGV